MPRRGPVIIVGFTDGSGIACGRDQVENTDMRWVEVEEVALATVWAQVDVHIPFEQG